MENVQVTALLEDGTTKVLIDDVSLHLQRGEMLGLIGESGAGKTTIALASLGYTRPGCSITSGRIVFAGIDIRAQTREQRRSLRGRRIAYVAQSAAISFNPAKRIITQVCEAPIRHGLMSWPEAERKAITLFEELGLPSPETFGNRYPHQVSGGQLQRAMAAMAMTCQPDLLIFDEPTSALDVTTQIEVLAAIRKVITDHRTAGLYISHDLAVVAQIADRVMVLRNGRMVEVGDTRQIVDHPREEYTRQLVSARLTEGRLPIAPQSDEPVLKIRGVSAGYGGDTRVVKDVGFNLNRGETLAVVGESGSGKSTLARVICGLRPQVEGEVLFHDQKLPSELRYRSRDQLRRIQLIYQMPDVALNPQHTVWEILSRPLSFYFNLPVSEIHKQVSMLLRSIELPEDFIARYPGQLSGGQKQRICIARALAAKPDVVVCDEVTSALDPLMAEEILTLLDRLRKRTGIAYLFITHDLGTVRRIADRVAIMLQGEVIALGPVPKIFSPPYHPYTEKLLASVPQMRVGWLDDAVARRVPRSLASIGRIGVHEGPL
jgi:peptide/nickel transport system ATP-binding protein